jgi:hypothetical protein
MEDDYYYVENEDKFFNLYTMINFWMIFGLVLLKKMGGITIEVGRT